jgi:hypothetical protein
MKAEPTTKPQDAALVTGTENESCCGGKGAADGAAPLVHHDHRERAVPSNTSESSCCCGEKNPSGRPT